MTLNAAFRKYLKIVNLEADAKEEFESTQEEVAGG